MSGLSKVPTRGGEQEVRPQGRGATDLELVNQILDLPLPSQLRTYRDMATLSLAEAFLNTQRNAAIKWIERSQNVELKARFRELATSSFLATQAVSHISPSNRAQPNSVVMTHSAQGFVVTGKAQWVTGFKRADYFTVGVELGEGLQSVVLIPKARQGVSIGEHSSLDVLKESETGWVSLQNVLVHADEILLEPECHIVTHENGSLARPYPALHTSALALGHAIACLNAVEAHRESILIQDWSERLAVKIEETWDTVERLASKAFGEVRTEPYEEVRASANAISFQSAALLGMAARGHGLLMTSPSGKLVAESRFFLVWGNSQRAEELTLRKILTNSTI